MKKILVVEDETSIREDLRMILSINNYEVLSAENGKEALEIIKNTIPDLILSDIMMPVMDGYELLSEILKNKSTADTPFLFLTAKTDTREQRAGMALGADDYITKPFHLEELLQAIDARLKRKEIISEKFEETFDDLRSALKFSLPHELRNPLNIIKGFTDILISDLEILKKDEIIEMLSNIQSATKRLHNLFENYIFLSNLTFLEKNSNDLKKALSQKTFSSKLIIEELYYKISKIYDRSNDVELNLEDSSIAISDHYFSKLVYEIMDNCFKFSKKGDKVQITTSNINDYHKITFVDFGRGMKQEQLSRIGEYIQFERKLYEQQGLGLGLTLSKKLIEIHNGKFSIESKFGHHTTITIELPRVIIGSIEQLKID